ncbi:growth regulator [Cyanobium sp. Copco_Reservoir_LC18]|nr:growth regulator [Cyanobium sp. Copco_Reservoir_LC18]
MAPSSRSQPPQPRSDRPQPDQRADGTGRRVKQGIRRWGNSLAVRIPAECLRQAGLREGDPIEIVVGPDGRLGLEPLQRLDRRALVADLRQLQASMPITPAVIEACRDQERW